jgi:D-alanyl-D-alanine carboxypeptidase
VGEDCHRPRESSLLLQLPSRTVTPQVDVVPGTGWGTSPMCWPRRAYDGRGMTRIWGMTAALTTITALLAGACPSGAAAADEGSPGRLQHHLEAVVDAGAVSAVARVSGRRGAWSGSAGSAVLGHQRPVPEDGVFRIGSITKTFVATVVLQLAEEGRLRLGDPLERWMPGVVPGGADISVRDLLGHTSGVPDYLDTLPLPPRPAFLDIRFRTWTPEELVHRALEAQDPAPRPRPYDYSNTNYLLLGMLVERVTGRTYAEEVERRIIRPLRLHDTSLPGTSTRLRGPHAHAYAPISAGGDLRQVDITRKNPSVQGAAGEMVSSAADLDRFLAALLRGRLLEPSSLAAMKPDAPGYGLGLRRRVLDCGVTVYGNDGDSIGTVTWSYGTAAARRRVVVSANPLSPADPEAAVDVLLEEAMCP